MADGFNNVPPITQNIANNLTSNLTGILSTRPSAKYASGARSILKINGILVGFAFNVSWRITTNYTEINVIDDPLPDELVPQRIMVEGTIGALHIPGQGAGILGWQPDVLSFLFHQHISIEVRDSQTDQLLFFTNKAVIISRQEDIKIDQLANVTLSWRAIGWKDEKTPNLPDGYNQTKFPPYTDTNSKLDSSNNLSLKQPSLSLPTTKIGF